LADGDQEQHQLAHQSLTAQPPSTAGTHVQQQQQQQLLFDEEVAGLVHAVHLLLEVPQQRLNRGRAAQLAAAKLALRGRPASSN